jgi:hypothetical protein
MSKNPRPRPSRGAPRRRSAVPRLLAAAVLLLLPRVAAAQPAVAGLATLGDYESRRSSSFDRKGANRDYVSVDPGQTVTIFDEDGPGEIRHIWITLPNWSEVYAHQRTVIRAWWDGEAEPSVEVPLGNFFGICFDAPPVFQSALITVNPEQALNTYFPMPFRKHGCITVTNQGGKPITDFYWNIDWIKRPSIPPESACFHAQYRLEAPRNGWYKGNFYGNELDDARKDPRYQNVSGESNYVILDAKGEGHFVGVIIACLQNQWGGWNEGDEMIWIDGEKEPRIHGTGGEDYFNGAWGFKDRYATPAVGLIEFTGYQPGSRSAMYRWHLEAPLRFHSSIKVTIEDGHGNLRSDNLYSVAYWYQHEPHAPFPPLPPVEKRIPKLAWTGGPGQDPAMK